MSNNSISLSSLDFDTLKQNFKDYLKTQDVFKDYNFDGSNINVLLDVMSYNSYLNSFYLNMIASEMFMDSAQKYDSVISHAKELNYLPKSTHSASITTNIVFETSNIVGSLTIPKGTRFFGTNDTGTYQFVTAEAKTIQSQNSTFTISDVKLNEGSYFQDSFIVDNTIENQRFIISNQTVDTDTITVNVLENNGATNTEFTYASALFNLSNQSNVYFLQCTQNGQYEVLFGDGNFGRKPLNNSIVVVKYITTNGSKGNSVNSLSISDDIGPINNGTITSTTVTVVEESSGGSEQQSSDSVRFIAPRYFAAQQRAFSNDDYYSLIMSKFGGEVSDVAVFGGQEIEPKRYGRSIISVKPSVGTIASDNLKNKIQNYLADYISLPTRSEIIDPDYLYVKIDTNVQYDTSISSKTNVELKSVVLNTIINYSLNNLETFSSDLRYSRLVAVIDNSDTSIVSNQTDFRMIKKISPKIGYETSYDISMGNPIYLESDAAENSSHVAFHGSNYNLHFAHASFISSIFSYNYNEVVYTNCYLEDDSKGNIILYSIISGNAVVLSTVGTIDYLNGSFTLKNLNLNSYDTQISLYMKTIYRDIFANTNKIILIDPNDITITITEKIN